MLLPCFIYPECNITFNNKLITTPLFAMKAGKLFLLCSGVPRGQRRPGESFYAHGAHKNFKLINCLYRHGHLFNGVSSTCLHAHVFVYTNRESIIEYSTQAFTHRVQKYLEERNSMKMQPIKLKIMKIKAS